MTFVKNRIRYWYIKEVWSAMDCPVDRAAMLFKRNEEDLDVCIFIQEVLEREAFRA